MSARPPNEHDFLAFLGCEPSLADASVPWVYNTASYEVVRGEWAVRLVIQPSYRTIKVTVRARDGGAELAAADIGSFTDVEIVCEREREVIIVTSGEPPDCSQVFLVLKPAVQLQFSR